MILRKLNISIKDIRFIFQAPDSETVLDVLGRKVNDIDGEVALLQDLKNIILEFIGQIKQADFSQDADIKRLYDKAAKVENRIANLSFDQHTSSLNRLLDVTDKLKKAPKYGSSGSIPFGLFHPALIRLKMLWESFSNGRKNTTIWLKK